MIQTLVKKGTWKTHISNLWSDRNYTQKGRENGHIASVHEEENPSSCKICDKRFKQSENLNGHIANVHEVKKPFKFNMCDPNFSQKVNLKRHISAIHEVIQTFVKKGTWMNTYQQFMKWSKLYPKRKIEWTYWFSSWRRETFQLQDLW